MSIELVHYYAKGNKASIEWVKPNGESSENMYLFSIKGLVMNQFSHCILYLRGDACFKQVTKSLCESITWLLSHTTAELFNNRIEACFNDDQFFVLETHVSQKLKVIFNFKFHEQSPLSSCLDCESGVFKFQLEIRELEDVLLALDSMFWAMPELVMTSDIDDWAMPVLPLGVGLSNRKVGGKFLAIRALLFDDMRSKVRELTEATLRHTWISLLSAINEDTLGCCISCGGNFAKAKVWQKECLGCKNKVQSKCVDIADFKRVKVYFGGSHLKKHE